MIDANVTIMNIVSRVQPESSAGPHPKKSPHKLATVSFVRNLAMLRVGVISMKPQKISGEMVMRSHDAVR